MTDLLDLLDPDKITHILMPCMAYACGGCPCGCSGASGRRVLGTSQWADVTCPECLEPGREAVSAEVVRQQGTQA